MLRFIALSDITIWNVTSRYVVTFCNVKSRYVTIVGAEVETTVIWMETLAAAPFTDCVPSEPTYVEGGRGLHQLRTEQNLTQSQTENDVPIHTFHKEKKTKVNATESDVCARPSGPPDVGYLISIYLFDSLVRFLFFPFFPSFMIKGHYVENAGRGSAFCGISEGS